MKLIAKGIQRLFCKLILATLFASQCLAADYFVWSGGGAPVSPYANWTDAAATVAAAITAGAGAGDIIKVHTGTSPHSESTTSAITWNGENDGAGPTIIGVDKDNSDAYTIATTDIITITSGSQDIQFHASMQIYGLWFNSADDLNHNADLTEAQYFQDCKFTQPGTAGDDITINGSGNYRWKDSTFVLGAASQFRLNNGNYEFINPTITSTTTDAVFNTISSTAMDISILGADFSSLNATVFDSFSSAGNTFIMIGNILHASASLSKTSDALHDLYLSGSDTSAGNNQWREERTGGGLQGTVTLTESIYRDSGATYDGSSNYSFALDAGSVTGEPDFVNYTEWNSVYVASGDSQVVTVYIANATGTLQDNAVWGEFEYFGATANTQKTIATTKFASPVATPANIASDTSTWTGISETAQKISVTIDIKQSGMLRWRIGHATATTVYVCPKIDIS